MNIEPDTFIEKKYKLSDDAIKAVKELVDQRIDKHLSDANLETKIINKYIEQLDKYMMKQYPDLSNRLNSFALTLDDKIKSFDKIAKNIQEREKKLVKSDSVYEDIYKIKDELTYINEFINNFRKNVERFLKL